MIRSLTTTAALLVLIAGGAGPAVAKTAPCRGAKGHFVKCPGPTFAAMAAAPATTKDAKGKCHIAAGPKKGQFTKCP